MLFLAILMVINSLVIEPDKLILSKLLDDHILFSVIIAQIFMYFVSSRLKEENIFSWIILLELIALPTGLIFQFGSEGITICICGYLCGSLMSKRIYNIFLVISLAFYAFINAFLFLSLFFLAQLA